MSRYHPYGRYITPEEEEKQRERAFIARYKSQMEREQKLLTSITPLKASTSITPSTPSTIPIMTSTSITPSTVAIPAIPIFPTTISLPPPLPSRPPPPLPTFIALSTTPSSLPPPLPSRPPPPLPPPTLLSPPTSMTLTSPLTETKSPVPEIKTLEEFKNLLKSKRSGAMPNPLGSGAMPNPLGSGFNKEEWYDKKNTTEDERKTCRCILHIASDDYFSGKKSTGAFNICPARIARDNKDKKQQLRKAVFAVNYGGRDVCVKYANFSTFPTEYLYTHARLKGYDGVDVNNFIRDPERWRQDLLNYIMSK